MKTAQWAHQEKEFKEHCYDPARAWFWQMRTGKSKMAIDNACALAQSLEINGVLVVAPNGVHRNWIERELPRHHWDNIAYGSHAWRNSDPHNQDKFEKFLEPWGQSLLWLAVNQESLIIERVRRGIAKFIRMHGPIMLVVDESHHFAVPGAKRTAVCRGLGRVAAYRRILSGTPVENSPLQAFSQFEILEKGALGYTTYADFKEEYAVFQTEQTKSGRRYPRLIKYRNTDVLKKSIAPYTSVVLRADCEELPPVQFDIRTIELEATQSKAWHDCRRKETSFFLDRGARDIADGGAALIKLQQIEGGFWKQDQTIEELVSTESNPKFQAVKDEVEQHEGQVIVWCIFRHEVERVAKIFGDSACVLYGGTSDRQRVIDSFRRGTYKVAVCQPQAVGEGQDFSTATKIVWFSQTPDAIVRSQANERATSMGKSSVQVVDLIVPGGVDSRFRQLTEDKVVLADYMSREGMVEILNGLEIL